MTGSGDAPGVGVIADDYTGATDVASALRRHGLRTELWFGLPRADTATASEAVIVALKSRTIPPGTAVEMSLAAARSLRARGTRRLYFKICSTFDSTDAGNIGPVTDALLDELGLPISLVCPASPEHRRTVYQGHLFVGDRLLSESPMRHHPLTPMTDSSLVRVLGRQTPRDVSLLPHELVRQGDSAVRAEVERLAAAGVRHALADAITDDDLRALVTAAEDLALLVGGAGMVRLLGARLTAHPRSDARDRAAPSALPAGPTLILAGSLSARTREQVEVATSHFPAYRLGANGDQAVAWLDAHLGNGAVMVHSWAPPGERDARRATDIEAMLASVARHAVQRGVRRLVVAGGETAGAVVDALGIHRVEVVGEADRGVPWLIADGDPPLALLLKSGNFGQPDLFVRAAAA